MKLSTVYFDIGGVLTPDPYETILLHEERGLGRGIGMTKEEIEHRVGDIWSKYATLPQAIENDFWLEISQALGLDPDTGEIERVRDEVIVPNTEAQKVFELLGELGIKNGVISNTTAFFYPFQANLLSLSHYASEELVFLSHEQKLTKAGGLYEFVARAVGANNALVIDDRPINLKYARAAGFETMHYELSSGRSLGSAMTEALKAYSA